MNTWLVGGLEHLDYFSHHIGNVIIPTDFHSIIFRGVGLNHQPAGNTIGATSRILIVVPECQRLTKKSGFHGENGMSMDWFTGKFTGKAHRNNGKNSNPSRFSSSPPARWGLLDFMSVACVLPRLLPSASPAPPRPLLVLLVQLRPAIHSVPCRTSTTTVHAQCSLPDLNREHPRQVFPAGPQPRPSAPSVPCRTSTTTVHAQCSLPDLNREHPRPVFPAGPQPRPSSRTSTTTIHAQCSLPDLNREYPRQKICQIECQKICQIEC